MGQLETARLRFESLGESHLPALIEMFADPEVMRYADHLRDETQTREWLAGHHQRFPELPWGFRAAIRKDTGEYAGHVGLLSQEVEGEVLTEVGYWFHRAHWGLGLATESAQAFRDYAFEELGKDHVVSMILPENLPSQAVARRNGMEPEREVAWRHYPRVFVFGIARAKWEELRRDQ